MEKMLSIVSVDALTVLLSCVSVVDKPCGPLDPGASPEWASDPTLLC
jgi:hypothetical protein